MKFSPMAFLVNSKRFNGSNHNYGPTHKIWKQWVGHKGWENSVQTQWLHPTVSIFFPNVSQSIMTKDFKFDPLPIIGLLKNFKSSDHENGVHRFLEWLIYMWTFFSFFFFVNISRFSMNQRLRFGLITVINFLKRITA